VSHFSANEDSAGVREVSARELAFAQLFRDEHSRLLECCPEPIVEGFGRGAGCEIADQLVAACRLIAAPRQHPITKNIALGVQRVEEIGFGDVHATVAKTARSGMVTPRMR